MAQVSLLGEQVNTRRTVDERTAFALDEILNERDYQDQKYSGLPADASLVDHKKATLEKDKQWSGSDWLGFMKRYADGVVPDMTNPETRKMFVKMGALALAALRAS